MNSEIIGLFAIVGIVLLVGVVGVSTLSSNNHYNLAGEAYRKAPTSSYQQQAATSSTGGFAGISSTSKRTAMVGDEGSRTTCQEFGDNGFDYGTQGIAVTFVPGDERNPQTTRRYSDFCKKIDGVMHLVEYACDGDTYGKEVVECACEEGWCDYILPPTGGNGSLPPGNNTFNCTDTDNGIVPTVIGLTIGTIYPNGIYDMCGVGTANGTFTGQLSTSCTAAKMNMTGNTCGVLDHECVNNGIVDGFVVCDACDGGVCSN